MPGKWKVRSKAIFFSRFNYPANIVRFKPDKNWD